MEAFMSDIRHGIRTANDRSAAGLFGAGTARDKSRSAGRFALRMNWFRFEKNQR
jgi:hypothetical protein